mgnify:FL=1
MNDKFQKKIIKNVKQIIEFEKIHQDNSEIDEKEILQKERLEKEIDEIVYSLYELDDDEKKIVDDNYPSFTKKKQ